MSVTVVGKPHICENLKMKMMSNNKFATIWLVVFTSGCGVISRPGDWHAPVVGGYKVFSFSADVIEVRDDDSFENRPGIPKKVVELGHNPRYIIAKQEEFRVSFEDNQTHESLIPGQYKYWILDLATDTMWGPLEYDEYLDKRENLGVPPDLSLRDVYDYKK